MKKCKLIIEDQVNIYFEDLDAKTRRECNKMLRYFYPPAKYSKAFKLKIWDGYKSFFEVNGHTYVNKIQDVIPIIIDNGYEIEIVDKRPEYTFDFPEIDNEFLTDNAPNSVWHDKHDLAGKPILLRDHQVEAVNILCQNPQSVASISTAAGKTLITATLSLLCESYGRTIVIVPNKSLVKQTELDYKNIGLDVGVYYGERKEFDHKHTICTWQSLDVLYKDKSEKLDRILDDVIAVIVDETHSAKADALQKILCGPMASIPIRWGITGTLPKEGYEGDLISIALGNEVHELTAIELMDKGILSKCSIEIIQLEDHISYDNYHDEHDFLVSDEDRLDWISNLAKDISKNGNTLLLVDRIETAKFLQQRLGCELVQGSTALKNREDIYDSVRTDDNLITIATYGVAAVGINMPRLFNLVLIEPGKSPIRVIQSIGRVIRKAKDKDFANIFDITSIAKFANRHMKQRKKMYDKAKYPYKTHKRNIYKDEPTWTF